MLGSGFGDEFSILMLRATFEVVSPWLTVVNRGRPRLPGDYTKGAFIVLSAKSKNQELTANVAARPFYLVIEPISMARYF